jgi:hypothetical protein
MRIEVKLPGPTPTTSASISSRPIPAALTSSSAAASTERASVSRSPAGSPSWMSAQLVTCVAVSKAKIVVTLDRDAPVGFVDVCERHRCTQRAGGHPLRPFRPLHEANRAIEVRFEIAPPFGTDGVEPVEVEMRNRHSALVAVADGERRARHGRLDAQRPAGATDERRLAGAQITRDPNHVSELENRGEAGADRFGLCHDDDGVS